MKNEHGVTLDRNGYAPSIIQGEGLADRLLELAGAKRPAENE